MSPVDLDRNRSELQKAYQDVCNPKSDTDWLLFGYEGQSNVLKLVSKGDGGIEEMVDDLSSGQIMYAYCRVVDPNTNLPKFVLINWQGEGVPETRKGSCSNHMRDVTSILKGAHVTIHARTEDDVDIDDILKKVSKSSGANYSFHKEKPNPEMNAPAGPVGTKYERIKPQLEIKPDLRDKFWKKQQEEEKKRQEELAKKSKETMEKMEKERRERELREAQEREAREQERIKQIYERKKAEREAELAKEAEMKKKWEETQIEAMKDEEERRKRADRLRKERAQEAQSLVSQRSANPRDAFEKKTSQFDEPAKAAPPPPRKLQSAFLDKPKSQFDEEEKSSAESAPARQPSPPAAAAASAASNMLASNLPKRQNSDEEEEEQQDWGEADTQPEQPQDIYDETCAPAAGDEALYDDVQQPPAVDAQKYHLAREPETGSDNLYDDVAPSAESNPGAHSDEALYDDIGNNLQETSEFPPEKGLVARALFDYQACEDNEISFDPDDLITNIDRIDPGWWIGTAPDGTQGMFPSNYVKLLNG